MLFTNRNLPRNRAWDITTCHFAPKVVEFLIYAKIIVANRIFATFTTPYLRDRNMLLKEKKLKKTSKETLTSLELFAGAGGLALGIHKAGFKTMGVIEREKKAVETLKINVPKVLGLSPEGIISQDARLVNYKDYSGKIDLLAGGPPCQPFSNSGRNRGYLDERDGFPIILDAIGDILPKAVLIENVRGLLRKRFTNYVSYIEERMRKPRIRREENEEWLHHYERLKAVDDSTIPDNEKYFVQHFLVDAANYGVPQRRERVFFVAFRLDLGIKSFSVPPTHSKAALIYSQFVTNEYWSKHGIDSHDSHLGPGLKREIKRFLEKPEEKLLKPWVTVRDAITDLPRPVKRGDVEDIPNHTQHPGARIYSGHIGSFMDLPSKTLKAGTNGTPGGENMLREDRYGKSMHPRYFTTREAARIQAFPDTWRFHGQMGACIKQLGNAVPVALAKAFAKEIHNRLLSTED